jgi:hypothetical protein
MKGTNIILSSQQHYIWAKYKEGLTIKQIAIQMDRSPALISKQLQRVGLKIGFEKVKGFDKRQIQFKKARRKDSIDSNDWNDYQEFLRQKQRRKNGKD